MGLKLAIERHKHTPLRTMALSVFCTMTVSTVVVGNPCDQKNVTHSDDDQGEAWQIAVTMVMVSGMLVAMAREFAPADMLMLSAVIFSVVLGIISISEAVQGFSNTGMLTVAVLLVVAEAVKKTGAVNPIKGLLDSKRFERQPLQLVLFRFMLPVLMLSAFLNNTPVVAMMIPVLVGFSNAHGIQPSKLLIPLSYSSIFGGTCTLMGTSTNLVVYGLVQEKDPSFKMTLFEIGVVGLPVALAGVLFVIILGPRYLPDRESQFVETVQGLNEYTITLVVRDPSELPEGTSLVGSTIAEIDLYNVPGVSLIKIERTMTSHLAANTILKPDPDTILRSGDHLVFTANVERMVELAKNVDRGLAFMYKNANSLGGTELALVEAKVGRSSRLAGRTLREVRFRQQYNASVLAIHREGKSKQIQPVGTFEMRRGDRLLLLAATNFKEEYLKNYVTDFVAVIELSSAPVKRRKAMTATILCLGMIIASVSGVELLTAALVTAVLLVNSKCLSANDVYASLNLPVLVVIASAFGISHAMVNSGSAALIAQGLVRGSEPFGLVGLKVVIYIVTVLFSAAVTNNAAVTIMFPIAYKAAEDIGEDFRPYMYTIMMGASASFMTPTGYQTNLMVHGPGGYRFSDFLKFGGLLQVWMGVITITVLQTLNLWWIWLLLFAGLLGASALYNIRNCISTAKALERAKRNTERLRTISTSELEQEMEELNMQRGQRYVYVPDLGMMPIDEDDPDEQLLLNTSPSSPNSMETQSLIC